MKLTALLLLATLIASAQTPAEIRDIAERAYIYAYPLVLVEVTRGTALLNRLTHAQQFPVPASRNVIRPNADTLYSTSWIDLSREPILIEVPDSKDRYYLLQFMDAWTETITATRHGLAGRIVVLPSEDMNLFIEFSKEIVDSLRPQTPVERELAQTIADGYWRLRHVRTTEDTLFALGQEEGHGDFDADHESIHAAWRFEPPADRPYSRDGRSKLDTCGRAARSFRANTQSFATLSIYEQRIHRAIEKATNQLLALQAAREARRQSDMKKVLPLRDLNKALDLPYNPAEDGFVYSSEEIETEAHREQRRNDAYNLRHGYVEPEEPREKAA